MKKIKILWLFAIVILCTAQAFSQEDLSVLYIKRLPEIEYVSHSTNPSVEGWPTVGQQITWNAKVKHWGTTTATFNYRWYLDGVQIATGSKVIAGGTEVNITLAQNWTFERKELKFVIDPVNNFPDTEEANNEVKLFTDALSVGFYVEQEVYDYFHEHQHKLGVGSNSFEDWAQRHVRIWNDMLANAIYPATPNGVLDRIRLDKVVVVPTGDLPLEGGWDSYPSNKPAEDKTIDLIWGFPAFVERPDGSNFDYEAFYSDVTSTSTNNPFYFEASLFHELGHARYLIDVYGFNLEASNHGSTIIEIEENGASIDNLLSLPFRTNMPGLMNNHHDGFIDEYSAAALNLIEGYRPVCGNYNVSCNIGSTPDGFMQDLPTENRVLITDADGLPVSDANIEIYQVTSGVEEHWYSKRYDDIPDLSLTSDGAGYVNVGNNPFSDDKIIHTWAHANSVIIVRAEKDGNVGYNLLESWRFNMQYWAGHTNLGTYRLAFDNIISECVNEQPYHNLSGTVNPGVYVAQDYIHSNGQVAAGSNVSFKAGNTVRLLPGFRAQTNGNSRFHAFNGSCTASPKEEIADNELIPLRNYPNPFTGQTTIEFKLTKDTPVTLFVSDVTGKQIAVLLDNDEKTEGAHTAIFDGNNYPPGMYYYTIQAGEYYGTQKMILVE